MTSFQRNLRLYVDTTDKALWRRYLATGLFYGVTTNPKLLNQAGIPYTIDNLAGLALSAFDLGAQEIHLQVWGEESNIMVDRGYQLAAVDPRVSVKVPITEAGLYCAHELIANGTKVTLTAVHGAEQMLPVIALGAAYAAPYLGRMNDAGFAGIDAILAMQEMINHLGSDTRLLVASIRELSDLVILARSGVDTFTLVPSLVEKLLNNPLTTKAAAEFELNAGKVST